MNIRCGLSLLLLSFACSAFANEGNVFTGGDASTVITQALVTAGAGQDITLHINGFRAEDQVASASSSLSVDVDKLNIDKAHNSWKATLLFTAGGRNLAPINLSGTYDEIATVPVLKRQVRAGEVITADDIEYSKQAAHQLNSNTVLDMKDLVGKSPKRVISQERPIRQEEIASPTILTKGAHVTLVFRSNNLEIRTIGQAMDSGAKGDVVHVRNLSSKAIIEGVVETSDVIRVSSPETTSAEAM
jgi:flagella basal body P-ring formation protein FlgA